MSKASLQIALRLALCAAVAWTAWRLSGLTALVTTAPLFGIALARPLLDLAGELRDHARARALQPAQGRHYAFHGQPVQVIEDIRHERWIRAADVRRILGHTASDGALALSYPAGWKSLGKPAQPHFSTTALLAHLAKESSPQALRLRHWVEREVSFPAQRIREQLGIRAEDVDPVTTGRAKPRS
jgi:hypothetical protein